MKTLPKKRKPEPKCKCGAKAAAKHVCPYACEINNDESLCDCCEECSYQCAMDV